MSTNFADFFDPYNRTHLQAFQTMIETGSYPDGFVPDYINKFSVYCQTSEITASMAKAWINHHLVSGFDQLPLKD